MASPGQAGHQDRLLTTKLRPGMPAGLIDRHHLLGWALPGQGPSGVPGLTVVQAPAGYGKSSVLGSAALSAAAQGVTPAWLSLDGEDNEPGRLLRYLAAALEQAAPGTGINAQHQLQSGPQHVHQLALRTLLHDCGAWPGIILLFLDDAHLLCEPDALDMLRRLLADAPPNLRMVIASRHELPLDLSAFRLAGRLQLVDAAHLALTPEEIRRLAENSPAGTLSDPVLERLHRRTEGWAAGVRLFLLAARDGTSQESLLEEFDGRDRHISDYLGRAVLHSQPPPIRRFLLHTAVLDRFCADLCDALLGGRTARAVLSALDRGGLFVIPLDRQRRWYRYHHLFGDFLRDRLDEEAPEAAAANCRAAAHWFAGQGWRAEAIGYAKRGGDHAHAAALIAAGAAETGQYRGDHGSILQWTRDLPEGCQDRWPEIRLGKAWSLTFTHDHAAAATELARVDMAASAAPRGQADALRQAADMIRCVAAALRGDAGCARDLSAGWLARWPEPPDFNRGTVGNALAYACAVTGEFALGLQAVEDAAAAFRRCDGHYGVAWAIAIEGMLLTGQGKLHRADTVLRQGLAHARQSWGRHSHAASLIQLLRAPVLYGTGAVAEAAAALAEGETAAWQIGSPEFLAIACATGARLAAAVDTDAALQILHDGRARAQERGLPGLAARLAAEAVPLLLAAGRPEQAEEMALVAGRGVDADEGAPLEAAVRIMLHRGEARPALEMANRLLRQARDGGQAGAIVTAALLKAVVLHRRGAERAALRVADEAVTLALQGGDLRRVADERAIAGDLLGQYLHGKSRDILLPADGLADGLSRLAAICGHAPPPRAEAGETDAAAVLGARECRVLALVERGLSNRQVAEALFLSERTVKWHLSNVFAKLEVGNRTAAVRKARQAGMLD